MRNDLELPEVAMNMDNIHYILLYILYIHIIGG